MNILAISNWFLNISKWYLATPDLKSEFGTSAHASVCVRLTSTQTNNMTRKIVYIFEYHRLSSLRQVSLFGLFSLLVFEIVLQSKFVTL